MSKPRRPLPVVSVIMSMHNSASTVRTAVRSILMQSLNDWELIVVDDGSSDRSAAIIEEFHDGRIRLVREFSSTGLACRLNQAVALSRGEFIARMDADDICFPERLSRQVERLREDQELDLLGCGVVVFRSGGELVGEMPVGLDHNEVVAQPFIGFPFPHPSWCGRADWFRKNPYDSRLRVAQDQDLLLRSFRQSKLAALDVVLLAYRQDRLTLKKMLTGRATFVKAAWRDGMAKSELSAALTGIAVQAAKGIVDVVTLGLGFNRPMQRSRLGPVSPVVAEKWQRIREDLAASSCYLTEGA